MGKSAELLMIYAIQAYLIITLFHRHAGHIFERIRSGMMISIHAPRVGCDGKDA